MLLKDMFAKPIDRDIQGVITIGREADSNVRQELEEYVVTREMQKHFAAFFSSYKKSLNEKTDRTGVWISGFFGSGKSHFLKMISYILDNKTADDKRALDYFIDGSKIEDPMVLADMKLAASVPNDVILFNIDSKSDGGSSGSKDKITAVFLRVFNEKLGFCPTNSIVAQLERELTDKGLYGGFKAAFAQANGAEWLEVRDAFSFYHDDIVSALASIGFMTEEAARAFCAGADNDSVPASEDLARLIQKYLDKQEPNRHIVFLADEVGQYIGSDAKLMLNLQTLQEDLAKYCGGRAWIVVTSQEAIDSIVRITGDDFSKIQGRFATRLSLSSANVDEVIRRRLLVKNAPAAETLSALYDGRATVIKNLITFRGEVERKLYAGRGDFAAVYPFVPYQFDLLVDVLKSIRTEGAAGRHLATGERSMLGLFQESAVRLKECTEGALVPFDMFYDALERFLDHGIRVVIARAYDSGIVNPRGEKDCFEVKVLKTLFMVKYVPGFVANVENITSLMVTNIDEDGLAPRERVQAALDLLCGQMFVHRAADRYIFRTDEEQEVDREIDGQDVQIAEVTAVISSLIFEDIYQDRKYKLPRLNNRYAFGFNQFVDERPHRAAQNNDIGLRVLTPDWSGSRDPGVLALRSMKEVIVLLPDDAAFANEIQKALKIEKYLRLNVHSKALVNYDNISREKSAEMQDCRASAAAYLKQVLSDSAVFVNGSELKLGESDPVRKMNAAMERLVETMYSKLGYIDAPKGEADIIAMLRAEDKQTSVLGEGETSNHLALADLLDFIENETISHRRTSLKTAADRFMKPPYGFVPDDAAWLAAKLFKDGAISLYINGAQITAGSKTPQELAAMLTKSAFAEKLLMEKREKASDKQLRAIKEVMKELFSVTELPQSEDRLLADFRTQADRLRLSEIAEFLKDTRRDAGLPGREILEAGEKLLIDLRRVTSTSQLFALIEKEKDALLEFAEDYEPIKNFYSGAQKDIFLRAMRISRLCADAGTFASQEPELKAAASQINDIISRNAPYGEVYKLSELIERCRKSYGKMLEEMRAPILSELAQSQENTRRALAAGGPYSEGLRSAFEGSYNMLKKKISECAGIPLLLTHRAEIMNVERELARRIKMESDNNAEKLKAIGAKPTAPQHTDNAPEPPDENTPSRTASPKQVSLKWAQLGLGSTWRINSAADVENRVAALREKLMKELEQEGCAEITVSFED